MWIEFELLAGEQKSFQAAAGTELFCAVGRLQVVPISPWLGTASVHLSLGEGWRAPEATPVTVLASSPSRVRMLAAPAPMKKPRQAGLSWLRLLGSFRGARRAA